MATFGSGKFKYINQPWTPEWKIQGYHKLFGKWNSLLSASWSLNVSFWQLDIEQRYVQAQLGRLSLRFRYGNLRRKKKNK